MTFIFINLNDFKGELTCNVHKEFHIPASFKLDHVGISVQFHDIMDITRTNGEKTLHGHAFSGFICDDEYYVYDSNNSKTVQLDWRKHENITNNFAKNYKVFSKQTWIPRSVQYTYSQGHYIMGSGVALAKRQLISTCHNFLYVFPPSCQLYITSGHPG